MDARTGDKIMSNVKKIKAILIGFAVAALPLVTTATCSPGSGTLEFYRNDNDHGFVDVFIEDDCYFYDDCYYYDDYYYEEIIIYD